MNGDGLANVIHADGLDHFKKSMDYKGKLKETSQDDAKDNAQFDILVANPPYSVSAFKNTLKNGADSFELYNRLTDDSSEIECLFIERTKQLLKPGGWAGVILPSSILSNSGIYTSAREIILKYFDLKAIAEFGSNTFMATGTNTVTLFLERKPNNEWKKIESAIKNFFDNPKDAMVNGIENAFSKYASAVFDGLVLSDYVTLINKNPSENVKKRELYKDYKDWFNSLAEVKQLKEKKAFKDKTKTEQQTALDKLFYEKVFAREQDKMLYFFLVYPQQTVLIKVGEKQAEKDFIGYEFSGRRGHEGLKMYRDENGRPTTRLYDDENHLNPEKANSYVYRSFLRQLNIIDKTLEDNVISCDAVKLFDFSKILFEKSVSINVKKKHQLKTKWGKIRIEAALKSVVGFATKIKQNEISSKGKTPVVTQEVGKLISGYSDSLDSITDLPIIVFGDHNCTFKYIDFEFVRGADGTQLLKPISAFIPRYFFYVVQLVNIINKNKYERHFKYLKDEYIPVPPIEIQESIIKELGDIEQKEKDAQNKILKLNEELNSLFSILLCKSERLGSLVDFKNGLNYSEKSTGDLVTVVGVKDFLEDFSPNLDKLVDVRIDGKLDEGYKLKAGDILVVRSNGSANLVGRFIYIDKLNKDTSYSGFTIRIRVISEKINSKYLCYCLRTDAVRKSITTDSKGANIKSVNQTMLSVITVPVPDIKEQLIILEKAGKLEAEIKAIETELANIDDEKKQILKKYLE